MVLFRGRFCYKLCVLVRYLVVIIFFLGENRRRMERKKSSVWNLGILGMFWEVKEKVGNDG